MFLLSPFTIFAPMWSKNKLKYVRSLTQKKYRDAEGVFIAEGPKAVGELAERFKCRLLVGTAAYLASRPPFPADEVDEVSERELAQASALSTAHEVMAVFKKPAAQTASPIPLKGMTLMLDGVQDPGNLGTIIRLADWFGIATVVCSRDCADAFAPKVVQATMGALARVEVVQADLPTVLRALPADFPVFGTFMDGPNLYGETLPTDAVVIMGNEGNGISEAVSRCVNRRIHIPNYPVGRHTVESLNVAVAAAITCSEFRRQGAFSLKFKSL